MNWESPCTSTSTGTGTHEEINEMPHERGASVTRPLIAPCVLMGGEGKAGAKVALFGQLSSKQASKHLRHLVHVAVHAPHRHRHARQPLQQRAARAQAQPVARLVLLQQEGEQQARVERVAQRQQVLPGLRQGWTMNKEGVIATVGLSDSRERPRAKGWRGCDWPAAPRGAGRLEHIPRWSAPVARVS